jgi:hypothetical protein
MRQKAGWLKRGDAKRRVVTVCRSATKNSVQERLQKIVSPGSVPGEQQFNHKLAAEGNATERQSQWVEAEGGWTGKGPTL